MRLINADELLKWFDVDDCDLSGAEVTSAIKSQPTAYDFRKVIDYFRRLWEIYGSFANRRKWM